MSRVSRTVIVVLNYKGVRDTLTCIESLKRQTYENFHIVIVENGSHDGSAERLRLLESRSVTVLCNDRNLGFAGGVNTGIRWAMAKNFDYVALFNNDATADKRWLDSLIQTQRRYKSGIVTSLFLHEDGKTIDSTGEWFSTWGLPFPRNRNNKASSSPGEGFVFGASGGCSLYSIEMLRQIGLFDEVFFAYYEDIDLSFRAQLAGWKVVYTPKAIAYHKQGTTSKKIPGLAIKNTFRNLPLLLKKNVPFELLFSVGIRFWFAYSLILANAIKNGHGRYALTGALQALWFTPRTLRQRFLVQRSRKVTVSYIKDILWQDLPPEQTGLRKVRRFFIGK